MKKISSINRIIIRVFAVLVVVMVTYSLQPRRWPAYRAERNGMAAVEVVRKQ